jgi:hypothetical protein
MEDAMAHNHISPRSSRRLTQAAIMAAKRERFAELAESVTDSASGRDFFELVELAKLLGESVWVANTRGIGSWCYGPVFTGPTSEQDARAAAAACDGSGFHDNGDYGKKSPNVWRAA